MEVIMLKGKNVALFIDVDNCSLDFNHFENAVNYIKEANNLIYGKVYGVSDKKNKEIIESVAKLGFDTACPMRKTKRGAKMFDSRIVVDVMDTILSLGHIDAVCVIAAPADMVYFYSKLRAYGISIMATDNVDDDSLAFVDDIIDIGYVEAIKPIVKKAVKKQVPAKAEKTFYQDNLSQEETPATPPQPTEEPTQEVLTDSDSVEEKYKEDTEEDQPYSDNEDEPIVETKEETEINEDKVKIPFININETEEEEDAQILRQIEKVRMTQKASAADDEQLLSEIKRLLAEFNKENE
jgi:hypothetical protein